MIWNDDLVMTAEADRKFSLTKMLVRWPVLPHRIQVIYCSQNCLSICRLMKNTFHRRHDTSLQLWQQALQVV